MKTVILAAGVGSRLAPLTDDRPKVLVAVDGRPLLFRQLDALERAGIASHDVVVVGGYRIDMLHRELGKAGFRCKVVLNEQYEPPWGNYLSLLVAEPELRDHDFLQFDGDVILDDKILPRMIAALGEALLATDLAANLDGDAMKVSTDARGRVTGVDKTKLDRSTVVGEYIGITKLSAAAGAAVFRELAKFPAENLTHEYYDHAYHRLTIRDAKDGGVPFGIVDVTDCKVTEIDDLVDLERAEKMLQRSRTG